MVKKVFLFLFILNTSNETLAWGPNGHRIVGEIANSHLSRKAKRNIAAILGNESIAISSNYADFIKSDSNMLYLNPWHYINFKAGTNLTEFNTVLQNDTLVDAYTKLNFLIAELKKTDLPKENKQFYLRLLIHIVGDIHQPLHVSHEEDQGGNKIRLFWFGESTNLHSVWDDKMIEFQKLSYTEYVANINHSTKSQIKKWQLQPMNEWFFETFQLAEKVYKGITVPEPRLGYRYNYDNIAIVNQQLLKGGIRLAGLLNEIFG